MKASTILSLKFCSFSQRPTSSIPFLSISLSEGLAPLEQAFRGWFKKGAAAKWPLLYACAYVFLGAHYLEINFHGYELTMASRMYECSICHQHAKTTLVSLLRHIREVHPHFSSRVVCGLDGCPATPSSFEALRRHIYRYHRRFLNVSTGPSSSGSSGTNSEAEVGSSNPDDNDIMEGHQIDTSPTMLGAQFILKTRDGKKLSQVTTDEILTDTKILLQNTVETIEKRVIDKLKMLGTVTNDDDSVLIAVKSIFSEEVNPFKGLETEYQQEKCIKENFNYVVSCQSS